MSTPPDLVGRLVDGRYQVGATIARGGMATVYRATDLRLDRPVALKVLREDLARDEAFVASFVAEARAAARLQHAHVVNVFDQGTDGDLVYLAMELVEGRTLRDLVNAQAPLTPRRALAQIEPVAQGLAHAHRSGLVHRDVKPENVLLGGHDGRLVKVADFGLARAVEAAQRSNAEMLWGTAAYLAPEQVSQGRADTRTDVYAVGLLLFELLAGRKAFPGSDPVKVASAHVHQGAPRLSEVVVGVPDQLDELVHRLTATAPGDRPADAQALLDELHRVRDALGAVELDRQPVPVGATSPVHVPQPDGEPTQRVGTASPTATRRIPTSVETSGDAVYARTTGNRSAKPATQPQPAQEQSPRRRRGVGSWLLTLLVLGLLGGAGTAVWWYTAGPGVHSPMPVVVDRTEEEARQALDTEELDAVVVPAYSETVPVGRVVAADQEPGTSLRHGTDVTLEVSQGPERYAVPQLRGRTVDQARADLEARTLELGAQNTQHDETVPAGQVITSEPAADTQVAPGTIVALTVSSGPAPVQVPSVVGQPEAQATSSLSGAGLTVSVDPERVYDDTVPEGHVVRQDPTSGTVERGSQVTLTISKGAEPVEVPDVFGEQYDDAAQILEEAGLRVRREDIAGGLFGTVREQTPQPGEEVPRGTEVVLKIV